MYTTVEARNLCFSFRDNQILNDMSFTIERNQFVSFIGPSGCGKTTLLNLLAGIYCNYTGTLKVNSQNLSFVFQHDSLLAWRNVLSNVLLPFELDGTGISQETRRRAKRMLSLVGLNDIEQLYPYQLSGGMKKRVEIARALVTDPELLILDEPFASLDIITREKLNILLKRIHKTKQATIILVTHSVEEACFLSEKIYVMSNPPSEITQIKSISNKKNTERDRFLLTEQELIANNDIREEARMLWNGELTPAVLTRSVVKTENTEQNFITQAKRWTTKHYNLVLIPLELGLLYFIFVFIKDRFSIPDYIFPHPFLVLKRFLQTFNDGSIFPHVTATVYESLLGFLLAFLMTTLLGYLIAKSRLLSNLTMPYLIAANTIPSVALAPFLVLWFGFGIAPKIITVVIIVFFPMLINNMSAITIAEENVRDLVSFYRPSRFKTFFKFELPSALPVIFSGVKVSITLSVIGAVIGEFVSGHRGLGSLVSQAKANFDVELMFVGLIWLIILGLVYFGLANTLFLVCVKRK